MRVTRRSDAWLRRKKEEAELLFIFPLTVIDMVLKEVQYERKKKIGIKYDFGWSRRSSGTIKN